MLRLIGSAAAAATLVVVAPSATAGPRNAGSAADYEFLAGPDTASVQAVPAGDCTLHGPYTDACVGDSACWINDPAAVQDPHQLERKRPRADDHVVFMSCLTPSGDHWARWYWSSQDPEDNQG